LSTDLRNPSLDLRRQRPLSRAGDGGALRCRLEREELIDVQVVCAFTAFFGCVFIGC
jgi:hypothetical protein